MAFGSNETDRQEGCGATREAARVGERTHWDQAIPPFHDGYALFLDVDGTLLDFSERPEESKPRSGLIRKIARLRTTVPVALVSGRTIADLDRLFAPLRLPAGGQHGAERRRADGSVWTAKLDQLALDSAKETLQSWATGRRGTFFEDKGLTLAIHYRAAPSLKSEAEKAAYEASRLLGGGFEVVSGNMIFELRPSAWNKGRAICEFMDEEPFDGHIPAFFGDDATDEDGFLAVNSLGGVSVKVGGGATAASYRARNVRGVWRWLGDYARHMELRAHGER